MQRRRGARAALVVVVLATGLSTLADTAGAAPSAPAPAPAPAPASVVVGADPLATVAAGGLDAWNDVVAGDLTAIGRFDRVLDQLATTAAQRLELDPATMRAAWQAADRWHQVALVAAFTQLGTPYHKNSRTPGVGFDCSGLTSWAWAQAGVQLFHQSRTQISDAVPMTAGTAQAGDLVYYPGHVMLWLGVDAAIIHAPFTGRSVEVVLLPARRAGRVKYGDPASAVNWTVTVT